MRNYTVSAWSPRMRGWSQRADLLYTATSPDAIRVRDSKTKTDVLTFTPDAWTSFVGLVTSGDVDFDAIAS
ncbi:DUF397 domain-containing protein [Streptomyces decoyicus]|uniref:DUF397 domain-containing protein n=1 Tax=Streptomyces decoyicus TaxID=249567 RepID=UPI00364E351F